MRVKIKYDKSKQEDMLELIKWNFDFDVVYDGELKDNGYIEIRGFEFSKNELIILD